MINARHNLLEIRYKVKNSDIYCIQIEEVHKKLKDPTFILGVQLSSHRFMKDAVNLIVRISMKLLIYHIKKPKSPSC